MVDLAALLCRTVRVLRKVVVGFESVSRKIEQLNQAAATAEPAETEESKSGTSSKMSSENTQNRSEPSETHIQNMHKLCIKNIIYSPNFIKFVQF